MKLVRTGYDRIASLTMLRDVRHNYQGESMFRTAARLTSSLLLLATLACHDCIAQVLDPLGMGKSRIDSPTATFWGQGRTESSDQSNPNPLTDASGKFITTVNISDNLVFFLSANKGVGSGGSRDSIDAGSLAFPETANSGLISKLEYYPFASVLLDARRKGTLDFPIFLQYSYQQYSLTSADTLGSRATPFSFNTSVFHVGGGIQFTHYSTDGKEAPLRLSLLTSVQTLRVAETSAAIYREFYNNKLLATQFTGLAFKLGLQYNDFGFEFSFSNFAHPQHDTVGGPLVGNVFQLAFTANAKILDVN